MYATHSGALQHHHWSTPQGLALRAVSDTGPLKSDRRLHSSVLTRVSSCKASVLSRQEPTRLRTSAARIVQWAV